MADAVPIGVGEIRAAEEPEDRGQSQERAVGNARAPGAALPENQRQAQDRADERRRGEESR